MVKRIFEKRELFFQLGKQEFRLRKLRVTRFAVIKVSKNRSVKSTLHVSNASVKVRWMKWQQSNMFVPKLK